ncbi:MAG: hypothetical protein ACRC62_32570 [Microcoleus sp.]
MHIYGCVYCHYTVYFSKLAVDRATGRSLFQLLSIKETGLLSSSQNLPEHPTNPPGVKNPRLIAQVL